MPFVKLPDSELDRLPPFSAEVKNNWSYIPSPLCLYVVDRVKFTFTCMLTHVYMDPKYLSYCYLHFLWVKFTFMLTLVYMDPKYLSYCYLHFLYIPLISLDFVCTVLVFFWTDGGLCNIETLHLLQGTTNKLLVLSW